MINKRILTVLFGLILLSPFVLALQYLTAWPLLQVEDITWGLKNSVLQSFFSALFSVLIGVFLARALVSPNIPRRATQMMQSLLLLPLFLPSLVVCLVLILAIEPFPFGNLGVILTQVFVYSGVVAVALSRVLIHKFGQSGDIALTLGSDQKLFWLFIVLPGIKRELIVQFGLIFAACFSSFSVPLLMGGGRAENIEVLILDSIRNYGDWSGAILLTLGQVSLLYILTFFLQKNQKTTFSQREFLAHPLFAARFEFYLATGVLLFFIFYIFKIFLSILTQIEWMPIFTWDLIALGFGTLLISFLSVLMTAILFCFYLFLSESESLHQFLTSYFAPSTALGALALSSVISFSEESAYGVIALVLSLLSFPVLYKIFWETHHKEILKMWDLTRTLGANPLLTVQYVLLPMLRKTFEKSLLVIFIWSSADFAISRVVSVRELTLAMRVDRLLSSYYFESAFVILLILGIVVGIFYSIARGVIHVYRRKT